MVDRLRVTELDFDTIKNNLKSFLKQQSTFTDYDFDGSGLSVLIDLLAYNTHYNAYYLNMVANESFLDTALLRDSAVSHAKTLGYTPHSRKAAVATITLTANSATTKAGTLTLGEGFSFLSDQIDGKSYNFTVLDDTSVTKSNNSQYIFSNLSISQGQLQSTQFTYDESSNPKQIFILPDKTLDTSTIKVGVQPNVSNTFSAIHSQATDILDVDGTSEVFFLQENRDGNYEIFFGNDSIGKKLQDGSIITVTYLVTNGVDANKANNFVAKSSLTDTNGDSTTLTLTPVDAATGGSEKETVDSIKFSAPNQFTSQNRLITKKDFETTVLREAPSIESISVWGGEDNVPVVYGKVFLSLKGKDNFFVSDAEKERIKDKIIKPKALLGLEAELVDPDFTFVSVDSTILYDTRKTALTTDAFKLAIKNSIITYKSQNLDKFDSTFSLSKLSKAIDDTDQNAIIGSETSVKLQKRVTPILGTTAYTIDFGEKLKRGTADDKLTTTAFNGFDSGGNSRSVQFEEVPQSFSGVSRIEVNDPGFSYTVAPTVTIKGDGSGATAFATISGGSIVAITLLNRGIDYTNATVEITGGNGVGGEASAIVDSRVGSIRSIFFDNDGNRQVINAAAGEVDYDSGIITINDINISSVPTSDGLIRFTIGSESGVVESVRNNIVTIDPEDPDSITVNLEVLNT